MASPSPTPPARSPSSYSRRVLIASGIIFGLVLLSLFLWYAVYVFLLAFAGVLLAILLRSLAELLERYVRIPAGWSLLVVILVLVGMLALAGWLLLPPLSNQVDQLAERIPQSLQKVRDYIEQYRWGRLISDQLDSMNLTSPANPEMVTRATRFVVSATGAIISVVVILFLGIYFAANPMLYITGILHLVPPQHRERGSEIIAALGYTLRWWLVGQLIAMAVVGLMTGMGLWLLGIPLAMTLGLLAALLDFVPNFGPIVAAIPAVLLALVDSPTTALYVVLLYLVVQQIEGLVITPMVHQKTVLLPPALTITAQVLLGMLVGPLGLLLATPLIAATMVMVKMLYVEDTLGDEVDTPDDHIAPEEKPPLPEPNSNAGKEAAPATQKSSKRRASPVKK